MIISCILSVQYAVLLYRFLKEWRKNPHWSFSCCLALVLPLNDLQGEIRGLAGANVLKHQMQTGQIEKPGILSALKNTGAIDVILEEGKEGKASTVKIQDSDSECPHAERSKVRCHQGTQTECFSSSVTDITVQKPKRGFKRSICE